MLRQRSGTTCQKRRWSDDQTMGRELWRKSF